MRAQLVDMYYAERAFGVPGPSTARTPLHVGRVLAAAGSNILEYEEGFCIEESRIP